MDVLTKEQQHDFEEVKNELPELAYLKWLEVSCEIDAVTSNLANAEGKDVPFEIIHNNRMALAALTTSWVHLVKLLGEVAPS